MRLGTAQLALRNLSRNVRRTGTSLAAIALGIAAMIVAAGFVDSLLIKLREDTIHSQLGHIQIRDAIGAGEGANAPYAHLLTDRILDTAGVADVPGVRSVTPRLAFSGLVSVGETTLTFTGQGIDAAKEASLDSGLLIVRGERLRKDDVDAAMLGEGLAANLGIAPGDKIILLANTAKGTVNAREVTVRGIFATVSKFSDDVALRIPIRAAQELLRVTGAQQWLVFLDKTERTTEVLQALESMPMAKQMAFTRWDQDADFYHKTVELFARQFGFARAVIAVIIVLSILNSMTMNVLERTQEVGVMLALGDPRRHILSVFTWEGTLLGLLGGILGAVIGIIVALILNALGIPLPPPPGMSHGFNAGVVVTGPLVAGAATVGIVATVLASLPPAYRASRLLAVEALRHGK